MSFVMSVTAQGQVPVARVQFAHSYPGNAVTFSSNNTAGNAIVVVASWSGGAPDVLPSVADSRGNTYSALPMFSSQDGSVSMQLWYSLNIAGGPNIVTVSTDADDLSVTAFEYSGVATSGALGVTLTQDGTPLYGGCAETRPLCHATTTPTSASFTPSAGSLVMAFLADEGWSDSLTADSGYTLIQFDEGQIDAQEDNLNATAAAQTAGFTLASPSQTWILSVLELKAAPPSSSPPPTGLFIADSSNNVVRQVTTSTGVIATVAGNGTPGYTGDGGPVTSAELSFPQGVAMDTAGNIYIADSANSVIRKVTAATGIITTVAGNGTTGYSGDGGAATSAALGYLLNIALDGAGNLYIADSSNNVIREVIAASGVVTTIAGNGTGGYSGDTGAATSAELNQPFGVALDSAANLYIADSGNNVIRKVTAATGVITTIAGNGTSGYSGDSGAATSAELNQPFGIALDSAANLYIADSNNNVIRKVTAATGVITTVAGNGTSGYSGDAGAATSAELNEPLGVALDSTANLYIADSNNNVIREVTAATGAITTIAGNGFGGYSGDGGAAISASLNGPNGIVFGSVIAVQPQVPTPTFTPATGTYVSSQQVTIHTGPVAASIRYTLDGSTPSSTTGMLYSGPITIGSTTTLNAIAYVSGYTNSGVATAVYTFQSAPSVTSFTPTSGAAGTQVTISGSNFGSGQGTGSVFLGTNLGTVVSWSSTQIVATVSTGSSSGPVSVQQGGALATSTQTFTVSNASVSSVTPASGLPGTQVTISGSGFGASQGNGQVWLGTMNGIVQSWSDSQVVATVAAGSATGNAQILQNGVWSNPVSFIVSTPQITAISPTSGVAGTAVTITGSGFGASQGSGTIVLGSISGVVQSWSDTQVVAAVAVGSLTGIARIQQNALPSNAKAFTVPSSGGSSVTLVPNLLNMVVGDTHTIQALNSSSQSITGLTWSSSNTNVVSLSTDDPPILTALAVGHVTITAGTAATDVTVSATTLPLGTVLWSNPGDGSGVAQIIPAVPAATGVADVFAIQNDGTIAAITSDGTTAWTANINPDQCTPKADFQGGLAVLCQAGSTNTIYKLDGITGQPYPSYSYSVTGFPNTSFAVSTDGTIFAMSESFQRAQDGGNFATATVFGINPLTGAQTVNVAVPLGEVAETGGLLIAGDGYLYMPFSYADSSSSCGPDCQVQSDHLKLFRINSAGANDTIDIKDWSAPAADFVPAGYSIITNADTGVLMSVSDNESYYFATTTGTSVSIASAQLVPSQAPPNGASREIQINPVLQREDGSFVGSWNGNTMVAFTAGGTLLWVVPNEAPQIATADGGVIGQSGTTYDQNGSATGQVASSPTYSWTLSAYQVGSVDQILSNLLRAAKN